MSHENLLVTQPAYNAKVTVESRLASEKYARYAERYPDDAAFQKLAGRDVAATFTVKGTSGQEDPFVTATCSVIGADLDGAPDLGGGRAVHARRRCHGSRSGPRRCSRKPE